MKHHFFIFLALAFLMVGSNSCGVRQLQQPTVPSTSTTPTLPASTSDKTPTTPSNNTESGNGSDTKPSNVVSRPTQTPPISITPPTKKDIVPLDPNISAAFDLSQQKDIALFLPFISSNYRDGMNMDSLPDKSKIALEFYQGFSVGLDNLRSQGINLNVQVFDTENNAAKVNRLLADSTTMQAIDLIIGPIHNGELKETATYAKKQKIYNISPFSPSIQNTKENPYYLIVNPPIETHAAVIYDYVNRNYSNKRIITVSGSKPSEVSLSALFSKMSSGGAEGLGSLQVRQLSYSAGMTPTADVEAQMSADEKNVFVVTNFADEAFIIDLANKLNSLRNRYDITIFGMPNWIELPNLPLDILANLHFHYTTPYFDTKSAESEKFRQTFYSKYRVYPTEYAAKAYDLITYFGAMQHQYGRQAGARLQDKQGLFTYFKFRPVVSQGNKAATDYLENRFINIIQFRSDYVLEKMN